MAGIYLHIPFCKQACTYCNFHFNTSLHYKDQMVHSLIMELKAERAYLQEEQIHTIYFGGGTPSLLSIEDCQKILSAIGENFNVSKEAEITLEGNPDDISIEKLEGWKSSGINRLSLGVQSFYEEELRWMNRAHTAEQSIEQVKLAKTFFNNITIDLIYGSPLLTDEMWAANIEKAIELEVPHLSCYALTIEEKTPLSKMISLQRSADVDPDKQASQFLYLMDRLEKAGFEHYEVSNFAKPGFRSRHNSSYWSGEKYLGLGPSAHSYNGKERRWNIANNNRYMQGIENGSPERESEQLTAEQRLNEYIMISLRTREGMDLHRIEQEWNHAEKNRLERSVQKFLDQGWLQKNQSMVHLSKEGMLRADGIAASLFS